MRRRKNLRDYRTVAELAPHSSTFLPLMLTRTAGGGPSALTQGNTALVQSRGEQGTTGDKALPKGHVPAMKASVSSDNTAKNSQARSVGATGRSTARLKDLSYELTKKLLFKSIT